MRDIFYSELRDRNDEIRKIEASGDTDKIKQGTELLNKAVEIIIKFCNMARKGGLLVLEETACELEDKNGNNYLKAMIMLIVDGTEPQLVEEISAARYFSNGLNGYEGLQYLVFLVGSLAIQAGENPRVIEEKVLALLPEHISSEYRKNHDEYSIETGEKRKPEQDMSVVKKHCTGESPVKFGEDGYFLASVMEYIFTSIDDRSIQRILRDVDNCDLTIAMKGLSGKSRERIFNNLSERLAVMIAEDLDHIGPVRVKDVIESTYKIFSIIIKLINSSEIISPDEKILNGFAKIIGIEQVDITRRKELNEAENELQILLDVYKMQKNKMI